VSAKNGDKSRFNRLRKQKIARRIRNRELVQKVAPGGKTGDKSPAASPAK
jgi:hypothetical protein